MPFNFTVIQSGVLYLKVKHSRGKNKAGTGVSCSFNLQVSQMDLRGPNKGDKKERKMKTLLYALMLPQQRLAAMLLVQQLILNLRSVEHVGKQ